jgi:L,D-transpeptidase YcbB
MLSVARVVCIPLAVLLSVGLAGPVPVPTAEPAPVDAATVARLARELGATEKEAASTVAVYEARRFALTWTSPSGALTSQADDARARLARADDHGLRAVDVVPAVVRTALTARGETDDARRSRDVALTLATLRYMRQLHLGRIDPRAVGLRLETWAEPHDFPAVLVEALAAGRVGPALDGLAPPFTVYAELVSALARYRELAREPWPAVPSMPSARPGDVLPAGTAAALRTRLVMLGDMTGGEAGADDLFEEPLVAGIRRFQTRHGLSVDGVIGRRTQAALAVPPRARVTQIEIALERLRWLPDLGRRRVIAVNIPMFRLWAWEAGRLSDSPAVAMSVIVGEAMKTETPVFVETLGHVIFRPYWNVPASIVRNEILPAVRRSPSYLAHQQMEIVRGPGDHARVVPVSGESLAALAAGALRLRQRPGPHNALGLVKFVFPNREGVYMHDTPTPTLFARDRRDFSHGCIRLADPRALARWALTGVDGWPPDRVAEAMAGPSSVRVDVAAPIDVVLFYLTAAVVPDVGALHFADDVYGHDARLARVLGAPR